MTIVFFELRHAQDLRKRNCIAALQCCRHHKMFICVSVVRLSHSCFISCQNGFSGNNN